MKMPGNFETRDLDFSRSKLGLLDIEEAAVAIFHAETLDAYGQIKTFLSKSSYIFDVDQISRDFVDFLGEKLKTLLHASIYWDYHCCRAASGDFAFSNYVQGLFTSEGRHYRETFPFAVEAGKIVILNALRYFEDLLIRLVNDWPDIEAILGDDDGPSRVASVRFPGSDSHCQGKVVAIVHFDSNRKIVYKPRDLAAEGGFQSLIRWMNSREVIPELKTFKVSQGDGYGWVEYVEHYECKSYTEIKAYYQRLGGLTALTYATIATDFHFENLVASGPYPCLIDLESILQPSFALIETPQQVASDLKNTVMATGILPSKMWGKTDQKGIDVGGLSGSGGIETNILRINYRLTQTGELVQFPEKIFLSVTKNQPLFSGTTIRPEDYIEDLLFGFTVCYQELEKQRTFLIEDESSPLKALMNAKVRVILRPTSYYRQILDTLFHPINCTDRGIAEKFLQKFSPVFSEDSVAKEHIKSEIIDLLGGDIPIFYAHPQRNSIWNSYSKSIGTPILQSAFKRVRIRLFEKMNMQDLERQRWFFRSSLFANSLDFPPVFGRGPVEVATTEELIERLRQLIVLGTASVPKDSYVPLRINFDVNGDAFIGPQGLDLYSGMAGTAIVLAELNRVGLLDSKTLERFLKEFIRRSSDAWSNEDVSAYFGLSGLLYSFCYLYQVTGDPYFSMSARQIFLGITARDLGSLDWTISRGKSGVILSLLMASKLFGDNNLFSRIEELKAEVKAYDVTLLSQQEATDVRYILGVLGGNTNQAMPSFAEVATPFPEVIQYGLFDGTCGWIWNQLNFQQKLPDLSLLQAPMAYASSL